ncbi:MAG TPA: 3-phosphoshikimate 1-carboxyvinyltransferase [Tepidisphaeraceae bacterium]|nr:3-phosphoshikimate 1-carboxyvinyltransferase [Tepidisphaeraceae bacterium]
MTIDPVTRPFSATITPPGSKSVTNRALILSVLAIGRSTLSNVLFADDTRVMLDALRQLGFELDISESSHTAIVGGKDGRISVAAARLSCGNSGTTIRFLTALCALGRGEYVLDGAPRLRERPIAELSEMLHHLGVRVRYVERHGFVPILVHADELPGGLLHVGAAQTSQFLSAILMVSPYARHEVRVDLTDRQTSWPYVTLTMQMMDAFGVTPELIRDPITQEPKTIIVPLGHYVGHKYAIEPDASNASYFLALAAIHPGAKITVSGLGRQSLQGDVGFAQVLARMGAAVVVNKDSIEVTGTDQLHGIEADLSPMPDTAQTLAVAALFADGRTTIHGLGTLRVKETDRLAALQTELTRLGATVAIEGDTLLIDSPAKIRPAEIATYDDHRMAMSFALAATKAPGVVIKDAECVNKTYPNYFRDLHHVLHATSPS